MTASQPLSKQGVGTQARSHSRKGSPTRRKSCRVIITAAARHNHENQFLCIVHNCCQRIIIVIGSLPLQGQFRSGTIWQVSRIANLSTEHVTPGSDAIQARHSPQTLAETIAALGAVPQNTHSTSSLLINSNSVRLDTFSLKFYFKIKGVKGYVATEQIPATAGVCLLLVAHHGLYCEYGCILILSYTHLNRYNSENIIYMR